jgi:hypothetical protein
VSGAVLNSLIYRKNCVFAELPFETISSDAAIPSAGEAFRASDEEGKAATNLGEK